jgi:hypothetical protein
MVNISFAVNFACSGNALLTKKLYHPARPRKGLGHAHFSLGPGQIHSKRLLLVRARMHVSNLNKQAEKIASESTVR